MMMLNLGRLSVSLTKHGAHKIADLIEQYDKDELLRHLAGDVPGINIDESQARKNLSAYGSSVPGIWSGIRRLGRPGIRALTLLAILFSHRDLIAAMSKARTTRFRGTVRRGAVLEGKAFTNLAHVIEELGFSTSHSPDEVSFDLSSIFAIQGLHSLAGQLFSLKLRVAGWNGNGDVAEVMVEHGLHAVLAISDSELRSWLSRGTLERSALGDNKDTFFTNDLPSEEATGTFVFRSGHTPKLTGSVAVSVPHADVQAVLRHNELQTALHKMLVRKYGADAVGTEVDSGHGTSIDVVVKVGNAHWFYEIKIAKTVRLCLRQAIPQLLEYAYWDCVAKRATRLIVVGEHLSTPSAGRFLKFMREKFALPLYYEQFSWER